MLLLQYSCFFVYLRLVMNVSKENVALFIAAIGILSVVAQVGAYLPQRIFSIY